MSRKRKNEDLDKFEQLERENKSLRTLNRSLMRHLKKINKGFKFTDGGEDIEVEEDNTNICPACSRGQKIEVDLGVRKFFRCDVCNWRSKAIKVK